MVSFGAAVPIGASLASTRHWSRTVPQKPFDVEACNALMYMVNQIGSVIESFEAVHEHLMTKSPYTGSIH